jgi:hypothetical protein
MTISFDISPTLIILATAFNGIVAGASLDQSIKQLPSRHKIGPKAFSAYSQAADLGNGIIWYAAVGIGSASLTVAAAISILFQEVSYSNYANAIYVAAILSVAHSAVTAKAAPTNFQQRKVSNDEQALMHVFRHFERLHLVRAVLQVATFGAILFGLYVRLGS